MKLKIGYFYFVIDRNGFFLEIGSIDKPTHLFTVSFSLNWWKD